MKMFETSKLKKFATVAGVALTLPFGSLTTFATPVPTAVQADAGIYQSSDFQRVEWTEEKRQKLRRAYWLLDHADREYDGHKGKAMTHVKEAGKIMGIDWHGKGWGGEEHVKWSDERLRESRQLLVDVAEESGGPKEHEQLRMAIKELDKALLVH